MRESLGGRNMSIKRVVLILVLMAALAPAALADTTYAVLFSGGGDRYNNHVRYYEETLRMWEITKDMFGVGNVWVLAADGTDTAVDRSDGLNSDWSSIVNAGGHITSATGANLRSTLESLDITPDVSFYFWSFDHGSGGGTGDADVTLVGWNNDWVEDDELASWVSGYNGKAECYAFAQCFAGGMVDDLDLTNRTNRFAAWAADYYESSWGKGWADAWADALEAGIRTTHALGQYAIDNDPYGPSGSGQEHPGFAGLDFDIITNDPVNPPPVTPELPSGLLVLVSALPIAFVVRRRRKV